MPTPAPCLDEQTVLDWIEGRLTAEERARADEHLESCETCREWVASLASRVASTTEVPEIPTWSEGPDPEKPALPSLIAGQRLAHYTIQGILGTGGMSVVYAALDEDLGRTVALKILRPNMAEVGNVRARLVREAQAMARLSHPNVVTVYEAKEEQGQLYIAMERVEGRTLRRWLAEEHPPLETLVGVFIEAGKGLAAAHAVKMVHRDFKPGNVLIGRDGRVRVTDFGLARTYASGLHQGVDRLTAAGMFVGTPEYASPEQLMGLSLDARSDQFCFCVAFFEAIYGERPVPSGTLGDVARAVQHIDFKPRPGRPVPAWARRILERGLQLVPGQRFPTMDELLAALSDGLAAERVKRTRWLVPAAALVLLGLVGGGVAGVRRRETPPLPSPERAAVAPVPPPAVRAPEPAPLVTTSADVPRESSTPRAHPTRREKAPTRPRSVAMLREDDDDAAAAPPAKGWLKLVPQGLGFADVYVDDQARGRVPRQDPLELPAGNHRIRLERSGKILEQRTVTVQGGATTPVPVRLDAQ